MCGIAGYVRNGERNEKFDLAFMLMAVFMDSRGGQSWGYTDGTEISKHLGEVQESFTPNYLGAPMAAVHTRWATTGDVVRENSHPFKIGDMIGMHNGMIYNHKFIGQYYNRQYKVDSEHIFHHINENLPLRELEGYGTIVFWKNGVTHIGCFNGGDLHIAKTKYGVVYCSTRWAIENAFNLMGLSEDVEHFYRVKDGQLYTIHENELWLCDDFPLDIRYVARGSKWQDSKVSSSATTQNTAQNQTTTLSDPHAAPTDGTIVEVRPTDLCDGCEEAFAEDVAYKTQWGLLCEECADWYYMSDADGGDHDAPEVGGDAPTYHVSTPRQESPGLNMCYCRRCFVTIFNDEPVYLMSDGDDLCEDCFKRYHGSVSQQQSLPLTGIGNFRGEASEDEILAASLEHLF